MPQTPRFPGYIPSGNYGTYKLPFRPTYNWDKKKDNYRNMGMTRPVYGPSNPDFNFWKNRYENAKKARIYGYAAMRRMGLSHEMQRHVGQYNWSLRRESGPYYRKFDAVSKKFKWIPKMHKYTD